MLKPETDRWRLAKVHASIKLFWQSKRGAVIAQEKEGAVLRGIASSDFYEDAIKKKNGKNKRWLGSGLNKYQRQRAGP